MHHEVYDPNDPLAHTLELCYVCHGSYQAELGTWKKKTEQSRKARAVWVTEDRETLYICTPQSS
jgi:hypothetical protein